MILFVVVLFVLLNSLNAIPMRFDIEECTPDGSCQFHAFSKILGISHSALRNETVKYIQNAKDEEVEVLKWHSHLSGKLEQSETREARKALVDYFSNENKQGDTISLSIISKLYKLDFCIVNSHLNNTVTIISVEGNEDTSFLLYNGLHYDVLALNGTLIFKDKEKVLKRENGLVYLKNGINALGRYSATPIDYYNYQPGAFMNMHSVAFSKVVFSFVSRFWPFKSRR
jgi:hypothetical protein